MGGKQFGFARRKPLNLPTSLNILEALRLAFLCFCSAGESKEIRFEFRGREGGY